MSEPENNPDAPTPERHADERLVHALLLHVYDDQAAGHREERVRRAIDAIEAQTTPAGSSPKPASAALRFPLWARGFVAAAAAGILVVVGIWIFAFRPTTALASLNDIISALGRPGDRIFHIQMEDLPEPPGRGPPDDQGPVPRPGLNDAKLYLRDGRQYVLERHDPNGGLIFDGFDVRQSWRVRNGVVAETREGLGAGGIPMPPIMADVPFSDLQQTLERIRVDYTVERLDRAALPAGGDLLRHVLVRRNSREVKGPETVEIWADLKTAMPRRIVFDRAKVQGNRAPCRLTFDLVSESPLPGDWFGPAAHAGRPGTPSQP